MRYLLIAESDIGVRCSEHLSTELKRYDIRAEIKNVNIKDFKSSDFKDWLPEIIVHIGPFYTRPNYRRWRKFGVSTCLLLIGNEKLKINSIKRIFDLVLATTPLDYEFLKETVESDYVGSPISDLVRKHEFDLEQSISQQSVGIIGARDQNISTSRWTLLKKIISSFPSVEFKITTSIPNADRLKAFTNVQLECRSHYDLIKNVNAAFTLDTISSLECIFLNCPQIHISDKKWTFGERPAFLINKLAGQEVIKSTSNRIEIETELKRTLQDHEYCATMLAGYQGIMEKIGLEPTFRKAGQLLAEWTEEKST